MLSHAAWITFTIQVRIRLAMLLLACLGYKGFLGSCFKPVSFDLDGLKNQTV